VLTRTRVLTHLPAVFCPSLQVAALVAAEHPGVGEFFLTPDEFVLFHSPAKIWQRVPVVARRRDAPASMLLTFHPRRLSSDPCRIPDMVTRKRSVWIDQADEKVMPASALDSRSAAAGRYGDLPGQRRYSSTDTSTAGDSPPPPLLRPSPPPPPPAVSRAAREGVALLSLQKALRPTNDAIGLSAALWKDQVGSWGKSPRPPLPCAGGVSSAAGSGWEAVTCSDDGRDVVRVKLLGLSDSAFGGGGGGRFEGTLPPELGSLKSLQELWLNIHAISGTIPPSFCRLAALRRLHLGFNSLTGEIPAQLGAAN
jgi:hypothetical protein